MNKDEPRLFNNLEVIHYVSSNFVSVVLYFPQGSHLVKLSWANPHSFVNTHRNVVFGNEYFHMKNVVAWIRSIWVMQLHTDTCHNSVIMNFIRQLCIKPITVVCGWIKQYFCTSLCACMLLVQIETLLSYDVCIHNLKSVCFYHFYLSAQKACGV